MKAIRFFFTLFFIVYIVSCGRTGVAPIGQGIRTESLIVDNTADVGLYNSLKVDSDDIPQVSYYDIQDGDLRYAKLNPQTGKWDISTLDSVGDVGKYTSMDLDSFDSPHIIYYDVTNDRLKYIYYDHSRQTWIDPQVLYAHGGIGASIVLDKNDLAHIAFIDSVGHDLYYMKQNPDGSFPRQGSENGVQLIDNGTLLFGTGGIIGGESLHISLTPDGRPVILYYNASWGALTYAIYDPDNPHAQKGSVGTGWFIDVIDGRSPKNNVGNWNDLYVAGENDFHICYYDVLNGDLKYAHFDGTRWQIEVVDSAGFVGASCSITLDHRNNPVISYYDSTNNDLKFAVKAYGRWLTFRLDTAGVVGSFTSIARFNKRERVGVVYHDWTLKALKFIVILGF